MLVFCHCPKTAGTSLFRAISMIHGLQHSYLAKRERPSVAALRARGVTFVAGHVSYEHYTEQTDAAGPDGLQFITFVRDPIQLTLSLYQHCMQHRHIWRPATRFFDVELPSRGIAKSEPQAVRLFLARCTELTGIRWDNFQVRFAVNKSAGELDRSDLEAATREADIISCVTLSHSALIKGAWLRAGQHVDLVGAFNLQMREVDDEALRRSRVFVDTEAALREGGDVAVALASGAIDRSHVVADLAALCAGAKGRREADEITLFKSVGAAIEDLAAAMLVWSKSEHS